MDWILLSIGAAFFFSLRYVVIKKHLTKVNTWLMAFAYRLFGVLFLLPLLFFVDVPLHPGFDFWKIIIITAILTGGASMLQLHALQKYDLSSSVPFMAFIPVFMILSVYLIFNEVPGFKSTLGILLISFGGVIINMEGKKPFQNLWKNIITNKGSLFFLAVGLIFGFTTTLDRIAIENTPNGGFVYTFYWHLFSVALFSFIFLNVKKAKFYIVEFKNHVVAFAFQGLFGIIAFVMQMIAVEKAKNVEANVLFIKAITLLYLFLSVLFGIFMFKEKNPVPRIIGSLLMLIGAVVIIIANS